MYQTVKTKTRIYHPGFCFVILLYKYTEIEPNIIKILTNSYNVIYWHNSNIIPIIYIDKLV
jgi:hypothetical protein